VEKRVVNGKPPPPTPTAQTVGTVIPIPRATCPHHNNVIAVHKACSGGSYKAFPQAKNLLGDDIPCSVVVQH
jgi:hypothetical protein